MKQTQLDLGDLTIDVVLKEIKNVHLSVHPPTGRVRIAAPADLSLDTIRLYAISKLGWIRQQQARLRGQERETPREFLDRESHYVWGRRYLLELVESEGAPSVELRHRRMVLRLRPGSDVGKKQAIVDGWYREQVKEAAAPLIARWEPRIGVKVGRFFVQRMKTRWGSSNPRTGSIRLNAELGKKPPECLEYIVVHELAHLLEPTHNARFMALMVQFMPTWRDYRDQLNRLPVRHEEWKY